MIHFIYAGHPNNDSRQSPYTVTRELYKYLKVKAVKAGTDVRYYDWCTMGRPEISKDDIIIGHPNYDENTIVQRIFKESVCKAKYLIFPLHTKMPEYNLPFDQLVSIADKVFNIMGPYWYDTIEQSAFAHWKPKIVRLDMAVDCSQFPYTRTKFNPSGSRHLVYVGHGRPEKNIEQIYEVMKSLPNLLLTWYGGAIEQPLAQLPNVRTIGWVDFTPDMVAKVVYHGDLFISCSRSDANPTTLLEAASWGLIPMCTAESGYIKPNLFDPIPLDDVAGTIEVINKLQATPEKELLERAWRSRKAVENDYTWLKFCETVWSNIVEMI